MLVRQLAWFAVVVLLFVPSALATEHTREDAIRFCKDYVREDTVTEKCINDRLATLPLIGCYDRVYDAAHLAAHKGQLVARATLSVKSAPPEWPGAHSPPLISRNVGMSRLAALYQTTPFPWLHVGGDVRH